MTVRINKYIKPTLPVTYTADIGMASIEYKIIKKTEPGCQVSIQYQKNPNPGWVKKALTCTYNIENKVQQEVVRAMNDILQGKKQPDYTGPLRDVLTHMN